MTWLLVSKGQREEYMKGDISKLKYTRKEEGIVKYRRLENRRVQQYKRRFYCTIHAIIK